MNIISSVLQQEVQELNKTATIYGINGPVIYLKGDTGFMMSEMVYVGKEKLVGESSFPWTKTSRLFRSMKRLPG